MKNLGIATRCPRPFDTILIDKQGMVYPCECAGWLPVPIGNLQLESIEKILEGERRRRVQDSILDGSYRHCEASLCSYLQDTRLYTKTWSTEIPASQLKNIRLGIDNSCNLSCPSCRTQIIYESRGLRLKKRLQYADKILEYITNTKTKMMIHVGSDGDPFASLVYRYFMRELVNQDHISLSLQTNGLLFQSYMEKNMHLAEKIKTIGLSIDGCTPSTYESLRRGGKFSNLIKNLKFIKELRKKYKFELIYHCVIQKTNYHEMLDYVKFAENYGADRIWFNRIVDWKTYENFKEEDVADSTHSEYLEFKKHLDRVRPYALRAGKKFVEFPTLDIE